MSRIENTIWCAGCGTEILCAPYILNQQNYCCRDCAMGLSCDCGQAMEREDNYRNVDLAKETIHQGTQ